MKYFNEQNRNYNYILTTIRSDVVVMPTHIFLSVGLRRIGNKNHEKYFICVELLHIIQLK